MKRIFGAAVLITALFGGATAQAEVVNQVNFQLKDVKSDGRYTVVYSSRSFDTTGAVPPLLARTFIRIPVGAKISKSFMRAAAKAKRLCDFDKLHDVKRTSVCKRARIGGGTAMADARLIINPLTNQPYVKDVLPYKVSLFLAKRQAPGAVASIVLFGEPDTSSPLFDNTGILESTKVTLAANFFNDPTPDGRFGYRLEIPTAPPVQGLRVSVAQVNVTVYGLTLTKKKKKCVRKRKGRCVKKKVKKTRKFWFKEPKCQANNQLPFQSFFQYETGLQQTEEVTIPCPAFKR